MCLCLHVSSIAILDYTLEFQKFFCPYVPDIPDSVYIGVLCYRLFNRLGWVQGKAAWAWGMAVRLYQCKPLAMLCKLLPSQLCDWDSQSRKLKLSSTRGVVFDISQMSWDDLISIKLFVELHPFHYGSIGSSNLQYFLWLQQKNVFVPGQFEMVTCECLSNLLQPIIVCGGYLEYCYTYLSWCPNYGPECDVHFWTDLICPLGPS